MSAMIFRMLLLINGMIISQAAAQEKIAPADYEALAPKEKILALSAKQYANVAERERAIVMAALADLEAVKRSPSPMTGWTAQLLLKAGRKEEGLAIVRHYMSERIKEAKGACILTA